MGRAHCGANQAKTWKAYYQLQPARTEKNKRAKLLRHLRNFPNDAQAISRMNDLRLVAPSLTSKGRKVLDRASKRDREAA